MWFNIDAAPILSTMWLNDVRRFVEKALAVPG
jgi:hypothetical protein